MDEKKVLLTESVLEEVTGGAGGSKQVEIVNCKKSCNVRSTPNTDTKTNIIGFAGLGQRYSFFGWEGAWAKVQFGARYGYIYKKFVKLV